MKNTLYQDMQELYDQLIDAWNRRDAKRMANLFAEQGVQIGFDGSKLNEKSGDLFTLKTNL